MKTLMILMARYDGLAVIPLDLVCRDYFRHLTVDKLLRKVMSGEVALPITRMEASQKAAKGRVIRRGAPAAGDITEPD